VTAPPFVDTGALLRSVGIAAPLSPPLVRLVERVTGIDALSAVCRSVGITRPNAAVGAQIRDLFAAAGIGVAVSQRGADTRPKRTGPVVFYGNHPFGIADALIALELVLRYRTDVKVLCNNVLAALDINRDHLIFIDPFDGESRSAANRRGLRETLQHVRGGGALLMFPAGACSHLQVRLRRITDPPWTPHVSRLVSSTGAAVVPLYFAGRNSWTFQVAGVVHPMLRTVMLLREFLKLSGRTVHVVEGPCDVPARTDAAALREAVYRLAAA